MTILLMMIPMSLTLGLLFVGAFIWAVKCGQYDDSVTPALRILDQDNEENIS